MPTLDDLAAQLAAANWTISRTPNGALRAVQEITGPDHWVRITIFPTGYYKIKERDEEVDSELHMNIWIENAIDLIRQWQSGARPEPDPVGAATVIEPTGIPDPRLAGPIGDAYAAYDSDPRVNGPDDFEAFADAVQAILPNPRKTVTISLDTAISIDDYLDNTSACLDDAQAELRAALAGERP